MINDKEKLGICIIPTGIGAAIGGYAGDAGCYVRNFTKTAKLIVNPNVVNAGGFSAINDKMYNIVIFVIKLFNKIVDKNPEKW